MFDGLLTRAQERTVSWMLGQLCDGDGYENSGDLEEMLAPSWANPSLGRFALDAGRSLTSRCRPASGRRVSATTVQCTLVDERFRVFEFVMEFENASSDRLAKFVVLPALAAGISVRQPRPDDALTLRRLELSSPVQRDDGTEVTIDHGGAQFDQDRLLTRQRLLAAFDAERMVAIQGVVQLEAPIDGAFYRLAYNHHSRSDPGTRKGGNLLRLVLSLYFDTFPMVDQFFSLVDVQNRAGLRLSFGEPWPTRLRRLFLPVERLQPLAVEQKRQSFTPGRAAALLNATHSGSQLWVAHTPERIAARVARAPEVYGPACWFTAEDAVLGVWASGERRVYQAHGRRTERRLALVLDYGFVGDNGRRSLQELLGEAAKTVAQQGVTHLALLVSEGDERMGWLEELAESADVYAFCAPVLANPRAPSGRVYFDQLMF
jgi:hypothetical protein